ncbi:hypothetical protein RIVM261_020940 [Rivularia sp. IAM M-261]|nr:hypothetical protein RIVM261_020940 [Rivularia sp. IAM M-261]
MSDTDKTAKGNVKICNRNHNHSDDWDDGGCCQDAKATNDDSNGALRVRQFDGTEADTANWLTKNQQKKPQ